MTLSFDGTRLRGGSSAASSSAVQRDCDIQLSDTNVSRRHAELRQEGATYWIVDLGSTNGIEVNGRRVKRAKLSDGDTITVGLDRGGVRAGNQDDGLRLGRGRRAVCSSSRSRSSFLLYLFIWRIVRTASRDLRLPQESFILAPSAAAGVQRVADRARVTGRLVVVKSADLQDGEGFELNSRAADDRPRESERHPDRDGRVRVRAARALRAARRTASGSRISARRTARS